MTAKLARFFFRIAGLLIFLPNLARAQQILSFDQLMERWWHARFSSDQCGSANIVQLKNLIYQNQLGGDRFDIDVAAELKTPSARCNIIKNQELKTLLCGLDAKGNLQLPRPCQTDPGSDACFAEMDRTFLPLLKSKAGALTTNNCDVKDVRKKIIFGACSDYRVNPGATSISYGGTVHYSCSFNTKCNKSSLFEAGFYIVKCEVKENTCSAFKPEGCEIKGLNTNPFLLPSKPVREMSDFGAGVR